MCDGNTYVFLLIFQQLTPCFRRSFMLNTLYFSATGRYKRRRIKHVHLLLKNKPLSNADLKCSPKKNWQTTFKKRKPTLRQAETLSEVFLSMKEEPFHLLVWMECHFPFVAAIWKKNWNSYYLPKQHILRDCLQNDSTIMTGCEDWSWRTLDRGWLPTGICKSSKSVPRLDFCVISESTPHMSQIVILLTFEWKVGF